MNLPNILAIFRMVLAPLLFFLLIHHFENIHQSWINYFAALTFSLAALSDFLMDTSQELGNKLQNWVES